MNCPIITCGLEILVIKEVSMTCEKCGGNCGGKCGGSCGGSCGGKCGKKMRLCPFSLGIAAGITCGIFMAFYAWAAMAWGMGTSMIEQWGSFYSGYAPTVAGGFIGAGWGLLKGFVAGFIFGLIYNGLMRCKSNCCCNKMDASSCNISGKQ